MRRRPLVARLTSGQWFGVAAALLALVTAVSTALGVAAIVRLAHTRGIVLNRNGPAVLAQLALSGALLNEETGVRGYALTGDPRLLDPYTAGRADERAALRQLDTLLTGADMRQARADTALVEADASAWRRSYADPAVAKVARGRGVSAHTDAGRPAFDKVRRAIARQSATLARVRADGRARFLHAAHLLTATFIAIVVLLVIGIVGALLALRITVTAPLRRVGRGVRRAARGDFHHEIEGSGPGDIAGLAADVDSMRRRIVEELSSVQEAHGQLDAQARDLQRSNAELEQFAYVASHDLQEPLRKVASFCQLLEQRYDDQLDERGRQYLHFAVDGAKRMQQLINDLLAFSRVGRNGTGQRPIVACDDVLREALTSLSSAIEESHAQVAVGPLPQVRGEPALLAAVFQNLIGNALKFHGEAPPRIEIGAERTGGEWVFSCTDDGIGIDPEYADRIFMIFQRLHPKESYAGTGIGLALCRKIVEYHGGRIWLDTTAARTTFRFTLPIPEESA